jgi:hypothetical protein
MRVVRLGSLLVKATARFKADMVALWPARKEDGRQKQE